MHILLDECVPRRFKRSFPGHYIVTVQEMGWSGVQDRELLQRAAKRFDVFVSRDRGIAFQQNLVELPLGVILLQAKSNRIEDLLPLVPGVLDSLAHASAGRVISVPEPQSP